jgi:hypothetical protein
MDIWPHYDLTSSRFAEIEASGEHSRGSDDTKVASTKITIGAELKLPEIIQRGIAWMLDYCAGKGSVDEGYNSRLAASGDNSTLAASGDNSTLAASGYNSRLAASGYNSTLAASGYNSRLAASG